jgi:hypothetical protein
MPQCQFPVFCNFCFSEKLHRRMKQKPKFLFFPTRDWVQSRDGGETGARHTLGWRGLPLARATRGCGHLVHFLPPPFRLYILFGEKTLNDPINFPETYREPPSSSTQDQEGPEALLGTLPERGITTGGLLHHHAHIWSDVWVVYLGLRVHTLVENRSSVPVGFGLQSRLRNRD